MTEVAWQRCEAPNVLFSVIRSHPGELARRWLWFNVACCWSVQHHLEGELRYLEYLHHVENWLRQPARKGRLQLPNGFNLIPRLLHLPRHPNDFAMILAATAVQSVHELNNACNYYAALSLTRWEKRGPRGERLHQIFAGQASLIRDIFGNPFRPVSFSPSWRSSTAVALAAQMYESRDFSAMPILADALQDAGCDNADVLDHCREPGVHARGCWVVDLVHGKE